MQFLNVLLRLMKQTELKLKNNIDDIHIYIILLYCDVYIMPHNLVL